MQIYIFSNRLKNISVFVNILSVFRMFVGAHRRVVTLINDKVNELYIALQKFHFRVLSKYIIYIYIYIIWTITKTLRTKIKKSELKIYQYTCVSLYNFSFSSRKMYHLSWGIDSSLICVDESLYDEQHDNVEDQKLLLASKKRLTIVRDRVRKTVRLNS